MSSMKTSLGAVAMLLLFAASNSALAETSWAVGLGCGLGAGITMIGAGFGIALIASRSVESMARQPEVAGTIRGAMLLTAAFIEGATFFSLIVCLLILVLGK